MSFTGDEAAQMFSFSVAWSQNIYKGALHHMIWGKYADALIKLWVMRIIWECQSELNVYNKLHKEII